MNYWTAFILGLVGSLHCAGMCGPLMLGLPTGGSSRFGFLLGRTTYNLGRMATYCVLGLVFGGLGRTFALAGIQRWVSILLGVSLLIGLMVSNRRWRFEPTSRVVAWLKCSMSHLLRRRTLVSLAVLGLLNGLLPCGLVYVACAGATAMGGLLPGAGYMAAFGAGTFPMMIAISLSGRLLPFQLRLKWQKAIPVCVFVVAALLIMRGMSLGVPYLSPDLNSGSSCCHK